MTTTVEIRHFHLFAGLGGGAKGFNRANPRVGDLQAKFRCLGGVDVDAAAMRDFERLTGVRGTVLDMFDRSQYRDFHGNEPPANWREATTADIHRAAGNERPHIVFLSAPCKGFSGLLSETRSKTDKYQALNRLTERGVWLMLEAWKDDLPELIVFENVPRIATRGRALLDRIVALLRHYGYAVAETTHDCGELGGLAQSRKRFLLVARHAEKVPAFLYQPERKALQSVGSVLGRMPLPGDLRAGPMHRVPNLQWKTWVRLAFVEAGSDWRSLNRLAIEDGKLRDYLLVPDMRNGAYGVQGWTDTSGVVQGESRPSNGNFSVADVRFNQSSLWTDGQAYTIRRWDQSRGAVTGAGSMGSSAQGIADPRIDGERHGNVYRVLRYRDPSGTITADFKPTSGGGVADPRHGGPPKHSNEFAVARYDREARAVTSAHGTGQCVADPRGGPDADQLHGKYHMTPWGDPSRTVIAGNANGAFAVADPRPAMQRVKGDDYLTGGHYGVLPMSAPSGAVSASACHDNGPWSVADHRMPEPDQKLVALIRAEDGTWHRPFTTLELAALQSLIDPEEMWSPDPRLQAEIDKFDRMACGYKLDGESDSAWRERIGNAVPPGAAEAIAHVMGTTLLLNMTGETFILSAQPVWVRPIAVGLAVASVS